MRRGPTRIPERLSFRSCYGANAENLPFKGMWDPPQAPMVSEEPRKVNVLVQAGVSR